MAKPDIEHVPFYTILVERQPEDHEEGVMNVLPVAIFANGSIALVVDPKNNIVVPITSTQVDDIIEAREQIVEQFYGTVTLAA